MNDPPANLYFGPFSPAGLDYERTVAPIGEPCLHCAEPIQHGDRGLRMQPELQPVHLECLQRMLLGSVAHQRGTCFCYGGSGEDDPALSRRQAALAAAAEFERGQRCPECGGIGGQHADDCEDIQYDWVSRNRNGK